MVDKMKKQKIALILVLYLLASFLTYGISLGFWQGEFQSMAKEDCRGDAGVSMLLSIPSPITLPMIYLLSGFAEHGLQFTCGGNE